MMRGMPYLLTLLLLVVLLFTACDAADEVVGDIKVGDVQIGGVKVGHAGGVELTEVGNAWERDGEDAHQILCLEFHGIGAGMRIA